MSVLQGAHRFEALVVGTSNRTAITAGRAVANAPGAAYNPLLIYARPGMGKTHLLGAIAHQVFAMNPDCTQIVALSGQHGKPGNSMVQVSESYTPNVFYGIVTNRENTIQAGSLVKLDARSVDPAAIGQFDEERTQEEAYTLLTPAVPRGDEASPLGRYRSPSTLPDGRVMVSWAEGNVNETNELSLSPPDYGVYWYNESLGKNQLIVNDEHVWELYAHAIVARPQPAIIPPRQDIADSSKPTTFGSINIRETSLAARHGDSVSGAQFTTSTPTDVALAEANRVQEDEAGSSGPPPRRPRHAPAPTRRAAGWPRARRPPRP